MEGIVLAGRILNMTTVAGNLSILRLIFGTYPSFMGEHTGSFTCPATLRNGIGVGEPIVAYKFYTEFLLTQYDSYEYPAGFVTSVSKGPVNDTVYLRNTGQGIYTGNVLKLYDAKIKTSVY